MKRKRMSRVLSLGLVLMILLSPLQKAFALTNDTQIINVEWENPMKIVEMEQQEQQCIVSTKTNSGRVNNFYFTFPTKGGVRFHADNEGVFKPEELSSIDYSTDGEAIIMSANGTTVKLYDKANPWRFEVYNEKKTQVVSYDANHISLGYDETGAMRKVKIANAVSEDETLFGLGERFNGFVQNGKTVEMWNVDCFTELAKSDGDHNVGYKNIPLLHSNRGYSVFHNNTYYGTVDVAESNVNECSFEFYGPILDMYIWTDSSEKNIGHYLELTGSTVLVPKWGLSYWAGQSWSMWSKEGESLEDISEQVLPRLDRYDELQTPIKNIYLEGVGDKKEYLDLTENLMKRGVHVFSWMNSTSYIPGEYEINEAYPYVKQSGPEGDLWQDKIDGDHWIDFTNPAAMGWAYKRFEPFLGKGLYGTMLDFNDRIDVDAYYPYNGGTGDWMHNFSCYYYDKTVGETFKNYYGEGEYINFARAACAGSQKYTAFFGGDQTADFLGLQESVSALLSGAASGINIWGSDIGGIGMWEKNDPEVYARWLEFGTFSPLMRTHGQIQWRDPWAYDENGSSEALFQRYYWTRENLVDMIYSATIKSNKENIPLTKPMVVAYPEEKDIAANGSQYLFCDNLLVAPVTEKGVAYQTVQFPEGRWVDLWNGDVYAGGQTIDVSASLDTIPVFIEAGSAFPVTFGETLDIGTMNTADKNVSALMVTPATKRKENKIYVSTEETQNFVCDTSGENIYTVMAYEESDKRIVVAMGCTVDYVSVDDEELEELSEKPTSASTAVGYYRDMENNATIIVTDGSWNSITYGDSDEKLVKFDAYYLEEASVDGAMVPKNVNDRWTINDKGFIATQKEEDTVKENNETKAVEVLTLRGKRYTNFELTYTFQQAERPMGIIFGTEAGKFPIKTTEQGGLEAAGGVMFYLSAEGNRGVWAESLKNDNDNVKNGFTYDSREISTFTDGEGTWKNKDARKEHTMKIVVRERMFYAYVDTDTEPVYELELPPTYEGGCVSFFSTDDTRWGMKDFTITDKITIDKVAEQFDAYYLETANETGEMEQVNVNDRWTINDKWFIATQKKEGSVTENNTTKAVEVLTLKGKRYTNFELTYTFQQAERPMGIIFGTEEGKFPIKNTDKGLEAAGGVMFYLSAEGHRAAWAESLKKDNYDNGKNGFTYDGSTISSFMDGDNPPWGNKDARKEHTMKIVVRERMFYAYVDGITEPVYELELPPTYEGGCVSFFSTDDTRWGMKDFTIKNPIDEVAEQFDAYYLETANDTGEMEQVNVNDRWTMNDKGFIATKKQEDSVKDNETKEVEVLTWKKQKYTDFELTYTFQQSERKMGIIFGAEKGQFPIKKTEQGLEAAGGVMFYLSAEGNRAVWAESLKKDNYDNGKNGFTYDGRTISSFMEDDPWDMAPWGNVGVRKEHTMRIVVREKTFYAYVDGSVEPVYELELPETYEGGYVSFFSTDDTRWGMKDFTIQELELGVTRGYIAEAFKNYREKTASVNENTVYEDAPKYKDYLFAGWFYDKECTQAVETDVTELAASTNKVYAKFVSKAVLTVKAQVSENLFNDVATDDETGSLRFVTTIDTPDYSKVGFEISYEKDGTTKEQTYVSQKAYNALYAVGSEGKDTKELSPSLFSSISKFFVPCTVRNIPEGAYSTAFTALPFWITLDGTRVYGEAATKTVQQGIEASAGVAQ